MTFTDPLLNMYVTYVTRVLSPRTALEEGERMLRELGLSMQAWEEDPPAKRGRRQALELHLLASYVAHMAPTARTPIDVRLVSSAVHEWFLERLRREAWMLSADKRNERLSDYTAYNRLHAELKSVSPQDALSRVYEHVPSAACRQRVLAVLLAVEPRRGVGGHFYPSLWSLLDWDLVQDAELVCAEMADNLVELLLKGYSLADSEAISQRVFLELGDILRQAAQREWQQPREWALSRAHLVGGRVGQRLSELAQRT